MMGSGHRATKPGGHIAGAVPVNDISQALGFYQGVLGMSVTFTNGDPVSSGGTRPAPARLT